MHQQCKIILIFLWLLNIYTDVYSGLSVVRPHRISKTKKDRPVVTMEHYVSKNARTLTSSSFDKHGLFL